MSEIKINLEDIIALENKRVFNEEGYNNYFTAMQRNIIKKSMLEFGKQLLELASEKAEIVEIYNARDNGFNAAWEKVISKQSILDTIKQVE